MLLVIGRVGRAHGLDGQVTVDVRTDQPQARFAAGSVVQTEPASAGPLTVRASRWHSGRLLVAFVGTEDRAAAEALRGTVLLVDGAELTSPTDPEEFLDHQLVGLPATTVAGQPLGVVEDVAHLPGNDLLVLRRPDGRELLVPFVTDIVPVVDIAAGRLIVAPPPGLLDLDGGPEAIA